MVSIADDGEGAPANQALAEENSVPSGVEAVGVQELIAHKHWQAGSASAYNVTMGLQLACTPGDGIRCSQHPGWGVEDADEASATGTGVILCAKDECGQPAD